jgi:predicted ATPase
VPLFVEELTKAVLESGLLVDAGERYELAGPLPPVAIPATLQDSLAARLDRLASVKEVAQIGAAIGREFSHELLAAVDSRPEDQLCAALEQLVAAELIFRRGTSPEAAYSFKHALVQEAAYQSLLKSRRQQLHARIGQILDERFPRRAEAEPEVLAHHFAEAGLAEKAVEYWLRAGERAIARSAYVEATVHLKRGLDLVPSLPDPTARVDAELRQRTLLGVALGASGGYQSPLMAENYARMHELCRGSGQELRLFTALWGLWLSESVVHAAPAEELRLAVQLLELARETGDPEQLLQAHHACWTAHHVRGEFFECAQNAQQGMSRYDPATHRLHVSRYGGHDPGVCCRIHGALALWALGHPRQALARSDEGIALATDLGHPVSLAFAHLFGAILRQWLGDPAAAEDLALKTKAICAEHALVPHIMNGAVIVQSWALAAGSGADGSDEAIRRALASLEAIGAQKRRSYYLTLLASILGRLGREGEALPVLDEALESARQTGEHWCDAEIHRLRGDMLHQGRLAGVPAVERCYREALAIAVAQGAKALELRATTSLARLWRDQGHREEGRDLLAPVYGWFSEGFDTPDLVEAKELLDAL